MKVRIIIRTKRRTPLHVYAGATERLDWKPESYAPSSRKPSYPVATAPPRLGASVARARIFLTLITIFALVAAAAWAWSWYANRPTGFSERLDQIARVSGPNELAVDPALSRDGSMLAYASDQGRGALSIWVKPLAGGEAFRLTESEAHDIEPDWHPDNKTVVFRSERDGGGIYAVQIDSKLKPSLLARNGRRPRFSPDGRWVAYFEKAAEGAQEPGAQAKLYILPAGGGKPRQLAAGFPVAQMPVWSSDGNYILFDGTRDDGVTDWWVAPIDGGAPQRTEVLGILQRAFWSLSGPDSFQNGEIFFSGSAADERQVWTVPVDAKTWKMKGEPELLTTGAEQFGQGVSVGDQVTYANSKTTMDVWAIPLIGDEGHVTGDMRRLNKESRYTHLPSVDVAGRRMVYLSNQNGSEDLWLADIDNQEDTQMTSQVRIAYRPVISADGSRLLVSTVEGKRCAVVVADFVNRKEEWSLEGCAGLWDWSPDRKYVLFFDPDGVGSRAAHLMEIPSGRRSELLWHPKDSIFSARFSPDGQWIAFTCGKTIATSKLYVAKFTGAPIAPKDWIQVTRDDVSGPAWAPNGKRLYFRARWDGFDSIYTMPLDQNRHPAGKAKAILRFEEPALGLFQLPESSFVLSISPDQMVLTLARHSGSVWAAKWKK